MHQMYGKGEYIIPRWLVGQTIAFFFVSMFACLLFFGYVPVIEYLVVSILFILLFLYYGSVISKRWVNFSEKRFLRNVFWAGVVVRLLWVLYMFFYFNPKYYGTTYGDGADVTWYMPFGEAIAEWLRGNSDRTLEELRVYWGSSLDDIGYPFWLAIVYLITGNVSDVLIPMLVKAFVGGYCAICIYHIANRHFGTGTARIAALFIAFNPNMIYWCGSMMKEAEMVFICCLCIDKIDEAVSSNKQLTFKSLLPGILAGMYLLFFRLALGLTIFLALFAHIVFVSNRVMSSGKKIIAGVLVALMLAVGIGDRFMDRTQSLIDSAQGSQQSTNMEWRANRRGGNSYARYAGAVVFAPLIFTIPFPTFNAANESQILQVQLSGGNYIKNVFSFFVIFVFLLLFASGEWRKHVFILAYTGGYLMVLVLSNFAQSGRFHMPVFPMLMLFSAYGIQIAKGNVRIRNYYKIVLVAEVIICLAWNFFKLKGRGMI